MLLLGLAIVRQEPSLVCLFRNNEMRVSCLLRFEEGTGAMPGEDWHQPVPVSQDGCFCFGRTESVEHKVKASVSEVRPSLGCRHVSHAHNVVTFGRQETDAGCFRTLPPGNKITHPASSLCSQQTLRLRRPCECDIGLAVMLTEPAHNVIRRECKAE